MVLTEQLLFGFITTIIGGLGAYVLLIEKRHRKERKEWVEQQEKERKELIEINQRQFDKLTEISEDGHKVIREHTNVISALKALLKNN